jgi:hypothetical protein
VHILGYHIDPTTAGLEATRPLRDDRFTRAQRTVELLAEIGPR